MKRKKYKRVIQRHHISHKPEKTVLIFRSEHEVLTKIERLMKSRPSYAYLEQLETKIDAALGKWLNNALMQEDMRELKKK